LNPVLYSTLQEDLHAFTFPVCHEGTALRVLMSSCVLTHLARAATKLLPKPHSCY